MTIDAYNVYCKAVCQCLPDVLCKAFDRHGLIEQTHDGYQVTLEQDIMEKLRRMLYRKIYGIMELDDNEHNQFKCLRTAIPEKYTHVCTHHDDI